MPLIKIPSGEITNLPYLEEIGKLHTPALLSTGMCNLSEITDALGILDDNGCPEVTILHCNTQYPTPMRMPTLPPCWSFLTSSACRSGFRTTRRAGNAMLLPRYLVRR